MNTHKNAPLTPKGREAMVRSVVEGGLSKADAACQFNTTPKTVAKWVKRFRAEGVEGLRDRSSRPLSLPSQTPPATCTAVEALRRQRYTGKQIAVEVERIAGHRQPCPAAPGTEPDIGDLEPAEPVRRYERETSRRDDPHRHQEARSFRAHRSPHHRRSDRSEQEPRRRLGVRPRLHRRRLPHRLLADHARREEGQRRRLSQGGGRLLRQPRRHGHARHDRQRLLLQIQGLRQGLPGLGLKHIRTRPYTPKTNGKAERFIQTALREWAYAHAYPTSDHRAAELPIWLHRYNWHRPHGGIKSQTPISRLGLTEDNLLRLHS